MNTRWAGAVRPPLGLGGMQFVWFDKLNILDAANPDTVYQATQGETTSNAKASAGNQKKIAIKLNKPWNFATGTNVLLYPAFTSSGASIPYAHADLSINWGTLFAPSGYELRCVLNVRYIEADYDETALTWNAAGGLTTSNHGDLRFGKAKLSSFSGSPLGTGNFRLRADTEETIARMTHTSGTIYGLLLAAMAEANPASAPTGVTESAFEAKVGVTIPASPALLQSALAFRSPRV